MRFLWLSAMILLGLAAVAAGRDIYVDNLSGDDRNDGAGQVAFAPYGGPVRSIAKALRLADKGDRIVIANTGTSYRECISLTGGKHEGTAVGPFVIEGNGATLDGSAPIPPLAWEHYDGEIFRVQPIRLGYQQLFINGVPATRKRVSSPDGTPPALEPLQWYLDRGQIHFRVDREQLFEGYKLACALHPVGITLYQVRDVVISDLVVQGYQLDGINAHDGVRRASLVGVTARGNGRSGVAVAGTSRLVVESSTIGDNGTSQVYTEAFGRLKLVNTQVVDTTAPAVLSKGGSVEE